MIDTGEVKNQSDLAQKFGVSRSRVSQMLNILKLEDEVISAIERLGDPMQRKIVLICMLSKYMKNPEIYKNELMLRLFETGLEYKRE
jgi:hypothetical protein